MRLNISSKHYSFQKPNNTYRSLLDRDFFFLKIFHQMQFIHNTRAGALLGAARSEIETVEVVVHNYLWEALGIINDPVRPEREVGARELSGASWPYN